MRAHGTRACYQALACRCLPCRVANAAYSHRYRSLKRAGLQPLGAHVSASEAWKRIRQLKAEHFTQAQIARAAGLRDRHLPIAGPDQQITLRMLLRIRKVYRAAFDDVVSDGPPLPTACPAPRDPLGAE